MEGSSGGSLKEISEYSKMSRAQGKVFIVADGGSDTPSLLRGPVDAGQRRRLPLAFITY